MYMYIKYISIQYVLISLLYFHTPILSHLKYASLEFSNRRIMVRGLNSFGNKFPRIQRIYNTIHPQAGSSIIWTGLPFISAADLVQQSFFFRRINYLALRL